MAPVTRARKAAVDEAVPRTCAVGGAWTVPQDQIEKRGMKRQRSKGVVAAGVGDEPVCRRRWAGVNAPVATPQVKTKQRQAPRDINRPVVQDLRTIVVNLDRREDRMKECAARLEANCPEVKFTRFMATDGGKTNVSTMDCATSWHTGSNVVFQKRRAIRKGWDDLDSYVPRQLSLSPGERGCSHSHIRAWRYCLAVAGAEQRPLLVLEDDAAPTPEFTETLTRAMKDLPSDAHLLYLGYSQATDWRQRISPDLVESEYVWTTVGYIVWPAGARILLNRLPIDQPVDNWMAAICAKGDIKAYCVAPKIIHQSDAWNTNSDVSHSDEQYWGPNSDILHSDAFYWGALPGATPGEQPVADKSCFWGVGSDDSDDDSSDM